VHPVNVETVAWITELKNTQSALFFFLCLLCYLRFETKCKGVWYATALVCAAAALLSKPSVVMLPTILLLTIWWERRRVTVTDLWRVAPVLAMSLGMSLLTITEQRAHVIGAGAADWQLGFIQRCLIAGKATWFYALKLLWPGNLMFVYPRWDVSVLSATDWLSLLGVIVVAFALLFRRQQEGARAGLFALGCFLQALFPVLGFFDVYYFRFSFVADHFNYLGSAVLLPFVAAAGARVVSSRPGWIAVASAVLLVLWALCWQRAFVFRDDERLWLDTLSKNPTAGLAHNNLGTIYRRRGDLAAAASHWREASRLIPSLWQPYVNLGKLQLDVGQLDEAARLFEQALRLKPDSVEARYGLATIEMWRGNDLAALGYLQQALQTRPEDARAHVLAGRIQEHQGDLNQALEQYLLACRLNPENAEAFLQLGFLRRQLGDRERAIHCFRRVLIIQPRNREARQALVGLGARPSD
jgi:tetratricopeptide (TPR) repeat protein